MELSDYLNQKTELFQSLLEVTQQMARLSGNGSVDALLDARERRDLLIDRIGRLDRDMGDLPESLTPGALIQATHLRELVKRIADINEGITVNVALRKQDMETDSRQAAVARKYTRTGSL